MKNEIVAKLNGLVAINSRMVGNPVAMFLFPVCPSTTSWFFQMVRADY